MSDSHEPSYYEIALTSRQAFTAFVLLLVCLLAAFFAGLWVGRGASPEVASAAIEEPAGGETPAEEPLEELKFFSESEEPVSADDSTPALPIPEAATSEGGTLLDQLAAQETGTERPGTGDRPTRRRSPKGSRPAPSTSGGQAAAPAPTRVAPATASKPAPEPRPTPPPATTPAEPPASSPPAEGEVVIQVFSSADQAQASKVLERLRGDGYAAYVEPVQESGQTLYRVRIGPFASREAAEPVAAKVRSAHRLDTWITRVGS